MRQKYSTAIIFGPKLSLSEQLLSRALVFGVKSLKKSYFLNYFPFSSLFLCQTTPQFWDNSCLEPNQFRAFVFGSKAETAVIFSTIYHTLFCPSFGQNPSLSFLNRDFWNKITNEQSLWVDQKLKCLPF